MTPHAKWAIAGVVVGLILFIISPWVALAVIAAAIAIPAVAYMMLDPSQRRQVARSPPPPDPVTGRRLARDPAAFSGVGRGRMVRLPEPAAGR